jgi:signal transduction histidine kinase
MASMIGRARDTFGGLWRFLRTSTLSRSIVVLLTAAILLLLAVNLLTFFMIARTTAFNDEVEHSQQVRRSARGVLISLLNAETGQRGFLLSGSVSTLQPYRAAAETLPRELARLETLAGDDPNLAPRVDRIQELATAKRAELQRTIDLASTGRIGEAVRLMRTGEGQQLMDRLRQEIAAIDEIEQTRLQFRTRQSEWAGAVTAIVNALSGLLILTLAGASAWLIRRYVLEIQNARAELDRANLGLEDKVRDRTAALTRANEEIQRFAYIVSHDLRAPLVNVMGYTSEFEQINAAMDRQIARIETAQPKLLDPDAASAVREEAPEAIGFIRASTAKMDRLINAILKLSREGRRTLTPEPLNMTRLVQAIADSLRHQTDTAEAEIKVRDLPWLESDRLSIEQIFGNLLDNAVKYLDADRPGRILIEGEEVGGGWVVFQVSDNGRGIAPKDHERIFELFRRSGRQDRTGEGLGLAFVRNSVRRLGGEIEVESELGQGSTFRLKFPKRLNLPDAGDAL